MKIETLKKAVELNKQREDILKQFWKLFYTRSTFPAVFSKKRSRLCFPFDKSGKEVKVDLRVRIVINGKTDFIIDDTSAGIKWIRAQIKRLNKINNEIDKL